jgi:tetratricopeptide (TPR) repeat protein
MKICEKNMSYIPSKKAKKYIDKAVSYFKRKNSVKALSNLQQAIEISPDYYDAWVLMGRIYFYSNKWNESLEALNKSLETFENYAQTIKYHPGKIIESLAPIWQALGLNYLNGFKKVSYALYCFKKSYELLIDKQGNKYIEQCLRSNPNLIYKSLLNGMGKKLKKSDFI